LSDGWHHIRLDVDGDSLCSDGPLLLQFSLQGLRGAEAKLLTLNRFLFLCRHRRFPRSLFPPDRQVERGIMLLRVSDALSADASYREIAVMLFGKERVASEWNGPSDSLRSQVRRLIADAREMASGGYNSLLSERR
jgi:hypothetical protein